MSKLIVIILTTSILLYVGYLFLNQKEFATSPFEAVTCKISGGAWERQGRASRYCEYTYDDAGTACFSNKDCLSNKCVVKKEGLSAEVYHPITDPNLKGLCSDSNMDVCFSGERLIMDNRTIYNPPMCD